LDRRPGPGLVPSLALSPLLAFVSTSVSLYVRNRVDLSHRPEVMVPLLGLAVVTWLLGVLLFRRRETRVAQVLLWAWYLAGPFFLASAVLRNGPLPGLHDPWPALATVALLALVATLVQSRIPPAAAAGFLGWLAALVLGAEVVQVVRAQRDYAARVEQESAPAAPQAAQGLPNVYHLVLDGFQTEMYEAVAGPDRGRHLPGFVHFPRNVATYGHTTLSLASIFAGRKYDLESPQLAYAWRAFNSESSLLHGLREAGYVTYGYVYPVYPFRMGLFHHQVRTTDDTASEETQWLAFKTLWVGTNLPRFMAERLVDREGLRQLWSRRVMPGSVNLNTYLRFREFLRDEEHLPARGRYTFVHVLLPHYPFVFDAECGHAADLRRTTVEEQTRCTLRLVGDLVEELRRLGRYDGSLIVVSGDHGSRHQLAPDGSLVDAGRIPPDGAVREPGELGADSPVWARARARALLLVKPAGRGADQPYLVSDLATTLFDIGPTIAQTAGFRREGEGTSLLADGGPRETSREFFFWEVSGPHDWTDRMFRFAIQGDAVTGPDVVPLRNNPRPE
jgi:hypothetical protein